VQSRVDVGTTITVALPLAFMRPEVPQATDKITTLMPAVRPILQDQTNQVKKSA
jgi:cell cycle sensor histidine kinase DivJ